MTKYISGFVAIVGRPNVGKSTLLNKLVGEKISITSPRAQTTRHRILGIKTMHHVQIIFVDTPGIHRNARKALNNHMNKLAVQSLHDVDVVIWMLESHRWLDEDNLVHEQVRKCGKPLIIVLNKVDLLKDKKVLLPFTVEVRDKTGCERIFPLSTSKDKEFTALEQALIELLPESEALLYPEQMRTDRDWRFRAGEMLREKLTRLLRNELPYSLSVEIEKFEDGETLVEIHALIWVERENHKAIVIGDKGTQLKQAATQARMTLEKLVRKKIMLRCWVKVKADWSDSEEQLQQWGYTA